MKIQSIDSKWSSLQMNNSSSACLMSWTWILKNLMCSLNLEFEAWNFVFSSVNVQSCRLMVRWGLFVAASFLGSLLLHKCRSYSEEPWPLTFTLIRLERSWILISGQNISFQSRTEQNGYCFNPTNCTPAFELKFQLLSSHPATSHTRCLALKSLSPDKSL